MKTEEEERFRFVLEKGVVGGRRERGKREEEGLVNTGLNGGREDDRDEVEKRKGRDGWITPHRSGEGGKKRQGRNSAFFHADFLRE